MPRSLSFYGKLSGSSQPLIPSWRLFLVLSIPRKWWRGSELGVGGPGCLALGKRCNLFDPQYLLLNPRTTPLAWRGRGGCSRDQMRR